MLRKSMLRYTDFVRTWAHKSRPGSNAQGPVAGVTEAAEILEIDIQQTTDGEFRLEHVNGLSTLLRAQNKGHFNFMIKEAIYYHVLLVLQSRTTDSCKGQPNYRKDMVGITTKLRT